MMSAVFGSLLAYLERYLFGPNKGFLVNKELLQFRHLCVYGLDVMGFISRFRCPGSYVVSYVNPYSPLRVRNVYNTINRINNCYITSLSIYPLNIL